MNAIFFSWFLMFCFILIGGAVLFWRLKLRLLYVVFCSLFLIVTLPVVLLCIRAFVADKNDYSSPRAIFVSEFHQSPPGTIYAGDSSGGADYLFISLNFQCNPDELNVLLGKMQMQKIDIEKFEQNMYQSDVMKVSYGPQNQFYLNDHPLGGHGRVFGVEKRFMIYDVSRQVTQYRFIGID